MSSLTGKELQIVSALSSADLPEAIIGDSCVKQLISSVVGAQKQARTATDKLQQARNEKSSQNMFSSWWNNTEDKIKDAQLNLTTSISNLNRHSSQLLIFNTAISKVLWDQQDILLKQQKILEEQADQLKSQNQDILSQQKELEIQQGEISKANRGLMEAKGVTAEQAQLLVGCVQRVEAAEARIAEVNSQLLSTIDLRLDRVRNELDAAQNLSVSALEARDKQLLQFIQEQQKRLGSQGEQQKSLEERFGKVEKDLPLSLEKSIEQRLAPVMLRAEAAEQKLSELTTQQAALAQRLVIGLSALAVALAGAGAAVVLL
jgi:hypothetical protein